MEIVNKKKFIEKKEQEAKVSKKFSVPEAVLSGETEDPKAMHQLVEEEIFQTVSATNIHELNNNLYVAMSNALTGGNLVDYKK